MATMATFYARSVKELQLYLQERGVPISNIRKAELVDLCEAATELDIEIDPDGLLEDREEVIRSKLLTPTGLTLTNPCLVNQNISVQNLPPVGIFDIYNYLIRHESHTHASLRDYQKMEGYGMFKDGHVQDIKSVQFDDAPGYFAIISKVKPRTKEKDPVTKLKFYTAWVVLTNSIEFSTGSVYSAYCCCKGG